MGYYIINKQPILTSGKQYYTLYNELFKDKDIMWRTSVGWDAKKIAERDERIINYLNHEAKYNPSSFYLNWVWFDTKDHVGDDVWDLLLDYCQYYGHSFLRREEFLREETSYEETSYDDEDFMDAPFSINHPIYSDSWLSKFIKKEITRNITIVIDPLRVNRIVGTLQKFIIYSKDFNLVCGNDLEIHPRGYSVISNVKTKEYSDMLIDYKYNIDNCSKNR